MQIFIPYNYNILFYSQSYWINRTNQYRVVQQVPGIVTDH